METAEFEEKEYEAPLYRQLLAGSNRIATPGQVFEFAFGIDACLEASNPSFWRSAGFPNAPRGAVLDDYSWGWIWRTFGRKRRLPTFSVNLLIQAKRPDFLKGNKTIFSQFGFSRNYWRYHIRNHQQEALCRLSETLGNRALVVYASPAFHTLEDLYLHTDSGTIVGNSNFARPENLKNHRSWNYDAPGTSGVAASKPEGFRGPQFYDLLRETIDAVRPGKPETVFEALNAAIETTVTDLDDNPLATRYREIIERSDLEAAQSKDRSNPSNESGAGVAFRRSLVFLQLVGLQWFVAGGESSEEHPPTA